MEPNWALKWCEADRAAALNRLDLHVYGALLPSIGLQSAFNRAMAAQLAFCEPLWRMACAIIPGRLKADAPFR